MSFTRHRRGRWIVVGLGTALVLAAVLGLLVGRPWAPDETASPAAPPAAPQAATLAAPRIEAQVLRVIDGDTIVVRTGDGREETVRYIGIDAPEIPWDAGDERVYRVPGWAARTANQQLVAAKTVDLELDQEHRDTYGRLLAYVYADDVLVNARLLEQGHAVGLVVPPNDRRWTDFALRQWAAVQFEHGLWADAAVRAIDWRAAGEHLHRAVTVEGTVQRVHVDEQSGIVFLNFGPNPRRDFVAVIRPPFTELFLVDLRRHYEGRRVRVRGVVQDFRGQPQIVVQLPAQIEVMD